MSLTDKATLFDENRLAPVVSLPPMGGERQGPAHKGRSRGSCLRKALVKIVDVTDFAFC